MNKLFFLSLTLFVLLSTISCKNEKQNSTEDKIAIKNFIVDTNKSVINWTAYKTTEKIPVKGVFKEVVIKNPKSASNISELINDLEFEIPVSSIFSNDSIRDYKLVNFFFGVMKNTLILRGKMSGIENGKGIINLSMNGMSEDMPFTYEVIEDNIVINALMNIDNWKAQEAINALNEACNDMHKAADSISKTWSEVALNIKVGTKLE
jgi:hypothetical protein